MRELSQCTSLEVVSIGPGRDRFCEAVECRHPRSARSRCGRHCAALSPVPSPALAAAGPRIIRAHCARFNALCYRPHNDTIISIMHHPTQPEFQVNLVNFVSGLLCYFNVVVR